MTHSRSTKHACYSTDHETRQSVPSIRARVGRATRRGPGSAMVRHRPRGRNSCCRETLRRRTGFGLVVDEPKTERSRRVIPLPDFAIATLREQRVRQASEKLACGPARKESGYVFTTPSGTPLDPDNVTTRFADLTERLGLGRRRFHSLRHSMATAARRGVPLEVISRDSRTRGGGDHCGHLRTCAPDGAAGCGPATRRRPQGSLSRFRCRIVRWSASHWHRSAERGPRPALREERGQVWA